jgi:hypothetical protein
MIGDNTAAISGEGGGRMRWLAAAMAISVAAVGLPAQASDELPPSAAGLAPLDDAMLATMMGGAAAGFELGANAEAGAVDLTATSSLQASISHSSSHLAGMLKTGDISLGDVSGAMGGVTSIQLSTGINNIQQNSATLAFAF